MADTYEQTEKKLHAKEDSHGGEIKFAGHVHTERACTWPGHIEYITYLTTKSPSYGGDVNICLVVMVPTMVPA